jgi:tRNA G18 (ribose-2'-O)-methylase SpoU
VGVCAGRRAGGHNRCVRTEPITDVDDVRLADYHALTDIELRTRFEEPHGLFVAEGELVLRRALRAGYEVRSVLLDAKRRDQIADLDVGDAPVYTAGQDLLEMVTGFHVHRGMLASFRRRELPPFQDVVAAARRLVILEGVNNHTNVGAIFRGAAALGMDAVLLSPNCADPLYRRSVRVSMGEVFAVPYARVQPWPTGLAAVREAGFSLLALSLAEGAVPIQDVPAAQRERPALLLGAEGSGLSAAALRNVDATVVIPMHRGVDSLNVAAAAAVACWELNRPQ